MGGAIRRGRAKERRFRLLRSRFQPDDRVTDSRPSHGTMIGQAAPKPPFLESVPEERILAPRVPRRLEPYGFEVFLLFAGLSVLFFGRSLIGHLSERYIAMGHDAGISIFFLEWWRYALVNHLNPFHINVVWAPSGYNLAWTASIPLAALAMSPIEITLGPVAAYNVALLLCPALSAWSAFFLCRRIVRSYWPALAGGYLFGFSPYMLAHLTGHLTLCMVFLLPVAANLVRARLFEELTPRKFVLIFAILLTAQFLLSLEVLASGTLMGAVFLVLLWNYGSVNLRARLWRLVPPLTVSYLFATILVSPYLYYFFAAGSVPLASNWALAVEASPLSLVTPAMTNIAGGWKFFRTITEAPSLWEASEYFGLPALLLLWYFARSRWHEKGTKLLCTFWIVVIIATFGQKLWLTSTLGIPMPWMLLKFVPVVKMILPARLSVYSFLAFAVIVAIWLSDERASRYSRCVVAALILISLLPNLSASYWTVSVDTPPFFKDGIYRQYLSPGEEVLILPYGRKGDSDIWLATTRMDFRLAGGYLGIAPTVPSEFRGYPIVPELYDLDAIPDAEEQFAAFLVQKGIRHVIVADQGEHQWWPRDDFPYVYTLKRTVLSGDQKRVIASLMQNIDPNPLHEGGVTLYRVPLDKLARYSRIDTATLDEHISEMRLTALIEAASAYISQGEPIGRLTPLRAQECGLLPQRWVDGFNLVGRARYSPVQNGLILGHTDDESVAVGLFSSKESLRRLSQEYGRYAEFPRLIPGAIRQGNALLFPPNQRTENWAETVQWMELFEFRESGLEAAAQHAGQTGFLAGHARFSDSPRLSCPPLPEKPDTVARTSPTS
jgi:hypothetical protein